MNALQTLAYGYTILHTSWGPELGRERKSGYIRKFRDGYFEARLKEYRRRRQKMVVEDNHDRQLASFQRFSGRLSAVVLSDSQ